MVSGLTSANLVFDEDLRVLHARPLPLRFIAIQRRSRPLEDCGL